VRFAEESASSEIWPMLKRTDEKWVTERAYENPKFVEDLVRDVALRLNADARIGRYTVDVENFESIHNHSAYARIERRCRPCASSQPKPRVGICLTDRLEEAGLKPPKWPDVPSHFTSLQFVSSVHAEHEPPGEAK
jgi:hypothetical protein